MVDFKAPFYGILAAYLEKTLRGHHIGRPILYSHKAVAFSVSGTFYKRLFFTLDGNEPMVLLSETEEKVRSFESSFLSVLKSELQNALVVSVSPVAGDRILVFELKINDAAYQEVTRRLVYEAVSHHPNLILLDENDKIIAAYRPSSLDSSRPILRGMAYLPPKKTFQPLEQYGPEDLERYLEKGKEKEAQLKADEEMLAQIRKDVIDILMPRVIAEIHNPEVLKLFNGQIKYFVNPTGKFVIGGPHGDTGLTGRKIIVDTYGGAGAHGGGAFSGKDPSKVDRSAAYAARHIAKNLVAAGVSDEILVQVSYAIGVARPINIYVNTYGRSHVSMSDGEIAQKIDEIFDMRPRAIEERLKLRNPIYSETAAYGHMGREPKTVVKHFESIYEGNKDIEVELFTWEKLDYVDKVKAAFGL